MKNKKTRHKTYKSDEELEFVGLNPPQQQQQQPPQQFQQQFQQPPQQQSQHEQELRKKYPKEKEY